MKYDLFTGDGATRLIVFFNGWGMDSERLGTWDLCGCDVLAVSDYSRFDPLPEMCRAYATCAVVAWSLGVWSAAASGLCAFLPPGPRIAVNGTLEPVSSSGGIPPEVFDGTLENWLLPGVREKFFRRISGRSAVYSRRTPESQKAELAALKERIAGGDAPPNPFRTVFIGRHDRIFSPAAQRTFWNGFPEVGIIERDWLHDPFGDPAARKEVRHHALL